MSNRDPNDYVLGTHDAELQRLGLQHAVWRRRVLRCWQNCGIKEGSKVLDIGAGPGFATFDLAEVVGKSGRVVAVEKSARFVQAVGAGIASRGLDNVEVQALDLMTQGLPNLFFDAAWTRWVACFVAHPNRLVAAIAEALRPGGKAIFHEYVDYATWKLLPSVPLLEEFVLRVMKSWRRAGGEPNIAKSLPALLTRHGLQVCHTEPITYCVSPQHEIWKWPASFLDVNLSRLVELGDADEGWARSVRRALAEAERKDETRMLTPMVLEIVATKPTD